MYVPCIEFATTLLASLLIMIEVPSKVLIEKSAFPGEGLESAPNDATITGWWSDNGVIEIITIASFS